MMSSHIQQLRSPTRQQAQSGRCVLQRFYYISKSHHIGHTQQVHQNFHFSRRTFLPIQFDWFFPHFLLMKLFSWNNSLNKWIWLFFLMDVTVAWYAESMGFMLPCQRRCSVQNLSPCLIIWCTDVFRQQAYLLTSCVGEGNPQRPPVFSASTHPFPPSPSKRQNFFVLPAKSEGKAAQYSVG